MEGEGGRLEGIRSEEGKKKRRRRRRDALREERDTEGGDW